MYCIQTFIFSTPLPWGNRGSFIMHYHEVMATFVHPGSSLVIRERAQGKSTGKEHGMLLLNPTRDVTPPSLCSMKWAGGIPILWHLPDPVSRKHKSVRVCSRYQGTFMYICVTSFGAGFVRIILKKGTMFCKSSAGSSLGVDDCFRDFGGVHRFRALCHGCLRFEVHWRFWKSLRLTDCTARKLEGAWSM